MPYNCLECHFSSFLLLAMLLLPAPYSHCQYLVVLLLLFHVLFLSVVLLLLSLAHSCQLVLALVIIDTQVFVSLFLLLSSLAHSHQLLLQLVITGISSSTGQCWHTVIGFFLFIIFVILNIALMFLLLSWCIVDFFMILFHSWESCSSSIVLLL